MMKVLNYGVNLTNNKCTLSLEDDLSTGNGTEISSAQEMKLLASSGYLSSRKHIDTKKPGKILTVDDFMNDPDVVSLGASNVSSKPSSASEKKKPPLQPPLLPIGSDSLKNKETPTSNTKDEASLSHRETEKVSSRASSSRGKSRSKPTSEINPEVGDGTATTSPKISARNSASGSRPVSRQGTLSDMKADPFNRSFTDL